METLTTMHVWQCATTEQYNRMLLAQHEAGDPFLSVGEEQDGRLWGKAFSRVVRIDVSPAMNCPIFEYMDERGFTAPLETVGFFVMVGKCMALANAHLGIPLWTHQPTMTLSYREGLHVLCVEHPIAYDDHRELGELLETLVRACTQLTTPLENLVRRCLDDVSFMQRQDAA